MKSVYNSRQILRKNSKYNLYALTYDTAWKMRCALRYNVGNYRGKNWLYL